MYRLVKYMFLEAGAMQSESYCRDESPWAPLLLGPHCPLFARKFPENTASQARAPMHAPPKADWHSQSCTASGNHGWKLACDAQAPCKSDAVHTHSFKT